MKDMSKKLYILVVFVAMVLCGLIITVFLPEPIMNQSTIREPHIEKIDGLTVLNFDVKIATVAESIPVRAVVLRKKIFRVTYSSDRDFPYIDKAQLKTEKILWIKGKELPGTEYIRDSWAGLFLAFDNDLGYIQSILHTHRIYRKHLNEFEIDYVFSSDIVTRSTLANCIYDIDKQVLDILKNNKAFSE